MGTESETYMAYLDDSYRFEDEARVATVSTAEDGRIAIELNQTIFYPQGGGQPADTGIIKSANSRFLVSDVRLIDNRLLHFGTFEADEFTPGQSVKLIVAKERRMLNARLHSAGHLIDIAVQKLGLTLKPTKGYHFPDSPYVEYEGQLDSPDKDQLSAAVEKEAQQLIGLDLPITAILADSKTAEKLCGELPDYVDKSKPVRVVSIGDNTGCPCAGTHLKQLAHLGHVQITKIKSKADRVKVGYLLK